jgi:hypothetical protein
MRNTLRTLALITVILTVFVIASMPACRAQGDSETVNLVEVSGGPAHGTFWSIQLTNYPPYPYDPFPTLNLYAPEAGSNTYFYEPVKSNQRFSLRGYFVETFKRSDGASFRKFRWAGNKSVILTPSTLARKSNSQSGARRNCASNFATDSRLTSQPCNCSFTANISCVQPFLLRNCRTLGPTRFKGKVIALKVEGCGWIFCSFKRTGLTSLPEALKRTSTSLETGLACLWRKTVDNCGTRGDFGQSRPGI